MDKELEIYYDHYKDTFLWLKKHIDLREKYFLYLFILTFILFLNSTLSTELNNFIQALLEKKSGFSGFNNFILIDSLLLFSILSISMIVL